MTLRDFIRVLDRSSFYELYIDLDGESKTYRSNEHIILGDWKDKEISTISTVISDNGIHIIIICKGEGVEYYD